MKKFSASGSDRLIVLFVIKAVVTTIVCVLLLSALASEILLKLDISVSYKHIISVIICLITAALSAFISTSGFKNNGALFGIIAQIPLIFYSLVNTIFGNNTLVFFLIKFAVIALTGALFGAVRVKKSSSFKV